MWASYSCLRQDMIWLFPGSQSVLLPAQSDTNKQINHKHLACVLGHAKTIMCTRKRKPQRSEAKDSPSKRHNTESRHRPSAVPCKSSTGTPINNLPYELLHHILSYLDQPQVVGGNSLSAMVQAHQYRRMCISLHYYEKDLINRHHSLTLSQAIKVCQT